MKLITKRRYTMAFKVAAVQKSIDSPFTVKSVADGLGIHPKLLTKWRMQLTRKPKSSDKKVTNQGPEKSYLELERENRDLRKRLERMELEADILKKANEYFDKKLK